LAFGLLGRDTVPIFRCPSNRVNSRYPVRGTIPYWCEPGLVQSRPLMARTSIVSRQVVEKAIGAEILARRPPPRVGAEIRFWVDQGAGASALRTAIWPRAPAATWSTNRSCRSSSHPTMNCARNSRIRCSSPGVRSPQLGPVARC
jgi:hypothetical protein